MPTSENPSWRPDHYAKRRPFLAVRQRLIRALRAYFDSESFTEVDTPILQVSPGNEVHLQAFRTEFRDPHGEPPQTLYLHTSPEFAMKKLLVAGEPKIFQLAHTFRNAERSSRHHPEFTMLEWYRSSEIRGSGLGKTETSCPPFEEGSKAQRDSGEGLKELDPSPAKTKALLCNAKFLFPLPQGERAPFLSAPTFLDQIKRDCVVLVRTAAEVAGRKIFEANAMRCDPFQEWEELSVPDAFRRYANIDLLATMPNPQMPDVALLRKAAEPLGLRTADDDSWESLFFRIMMEKIEPHLGNGRPTFLCDYPISMAALARPKANDPRLAERFELYIAGYEIANAFYELNDAEEQLRRFKADMDLKEKLYGERHPIDMDFIEALRHGMPEAAGIALGVDRLVMLCAGTESIEDVLWLPVASG